MTKGPVVYAVISEINGLTKFDSFWWSFSHIVCVEKMNKWKQLWFSMQLERLNFMHIWVDMFSCPALKKIDFVWENQWLDQHNCQTYLECSHMYITI